MNEVETTLADKISQIDSLEGKLDTVKSDEPSATLGKGSKGSVELPAIVVRSSPSLEKEKAEPVMFSGKILAVNAESNFVVIDLGMVSGVKPGDKFNVYREGRAIGSIEVIQVRDSISACDIKRVTAPLKIGDKIR